MKIKYVNVKEWWKDIKGYEGIYQISNKRRVKSLANEFSRKEKILNPQENNKGYLMVQLYKGGEKEVYLVHRLVAQAFLNNPEEYPIVNHKDENPKNNCVENLEWCTVQYNNTYGSRIEKFIKSKSIPVMCVETGEVFSSYKEAQEKTGIFASAIGACARGDEHFHTAGGYHWEQV